MNRLTRTSIALIAGTGLLLSGCAGNSAAAPAATGVWGDSDERTAPSLEFVPKESSTTSGEYHGTDGCNRVFGTYSQNADGVIDLGNMASTMMFCEGVDTWLGQSKTATIDENTMTFLDEDGNEIGTLTAQGA